MKISGKYRESYRPWLIRRVEHLRIESRMKLLAFHAQIGPVASEQWLRFCTGEEDEAWSQLSLKTLERIMNVFDVGLEFLQYPKSNNAEEQNL